MINLNRIAVAILLAGVSYAQQETVTYTYNGLPVPIATDGADVISVADISVPRALTITNVTARVSIDYPNSGDLQVFLYSPGGVRAKLLENNCSTNGIDTTFDDAATQKWNAFCPTELGRGPFQANEPLANFKSDPSSIGRWRIAIENNRSNDRVGWLTGFAVTITGTRQLTPQLSPQTIVNAASRIGESIAPGELVSIFGVSLGPTPGITAPTGALPTTLGGTSVTVNGTAVPISYASAYRVDIQAPFGLQPGGQATIRVTSSAGASKDVQIPINSSAPGIFVANPDGTGQAKVINQTGTLNSLTQPAAKGSIISVYASGLGTVTPAVTAGAVPPNSPLSMTVATVAASIGGTPARVWFAGLAPGIPGSYQVNIEVPMDARSGIQQLIISSNNIGSQSGAVVQIQ